MTPRLQKLFDAIKDLGPVERLGELTLEVRAADYKGICESLKSTHGFEQLIDLCGVDYAAYGDRPREGNRFAVVLHLLSIKNNSRLRVRTFCPDDEFPVIASLVEVWPVANWFEREAFDLFGIIFEGHPDMRRILTDYGFVGHPFRKDFPLIGNVEVRYDETLQRVIYEPVTSVEPRVLVPRVIRDDSRYGQAQAESAASAAKK